MDDLVQLTIDDGIGIITVNNPPVNALSPGVPEGISAALDNIAQNSSIQAAVLIGGGRTFVAGADIREFSKMRPAQPEDGKSRLPNALAELLLKVEDSSTPVVMAIHGTALGGGLELAMSAPYRVALENAQVGQPEVKLGLIPGAAGTQRLPRLAGVAKAVDMCAFGNSIDAKEALGFGIVDRIVEGTTRSELLAGAIAFAREIAGKPVVKTRDLKQKLGSDEENAAVFAKARATVAKKLRGQHAPLAAIDAVEASTRMSFEDGFAREQQLFLECLLSEQSRALIHVFFSEREAAKIADIAKSTPILPIESAAVVGAGTMGGAIAMTLVNAGIPVLLKETAQAALDRGLATIKLNYANSVKSGRFTQEVVDRRLAMITPTLSYSGFASVDLVIEAVFEGMALKKEVFKQLDEVCKPGAILGTNTSTLNIDEIASVVSRPEAVIGLHFFAPANVTRLLEVVRGEKSSAEVIATSMQLGRKLGKASVLVGNCVGFVGNRLFGRYCQQAQLLIEDGASVEAVDCALTEYGMALGPFATLDLSGLDVGWRIRKEHPPVAGERQPFIEDRLCEMGRFGRKTGAGWYQYDGERRVLPDPKVTEWIREWVTERGIAQRAIGTGEILDRTLWALVNEAARTLEEGYVARASDIDTIYVNGYGFPAWRGGPMWYADRVGLQTVYARMLEFQEKFGEFWRPANLLQKLAEQGTGFYESSKQS